MRAHTPVLASIERRRPLHCDTKTYTARRRAFDRPVTSQQEEASGELWIAYFGIKILQPPSEIGQFR